MNKTVKNALIIAGILALAGVLLFSAAFAFGARPEQLWNDGLPELSFVTIGGLGGSGYGDWDNAYEADGVYEVLADGLDSLDIRWIAGTAEVVVYDGSEVVLAESPAAGITADSALRYGVEDGVLYVQYCARGKSGNLPEKHLTVSLPRALAAGMRDFSFDASSASLSVSGLKAERFACGSTSGRLDAASITASAVHLDSSSGDIYFSGDYELLDAGSTSGRVSVESLGRATSTAIDTSSGGVSVSGRCGGLSIGTTSGAVAAAGAVTAEALEIDTSSGTISLYGSFAGIRAATTSGAVELRSSVCPATLAVDTSSGDVALTLPPDSGFTLEYDTSSGELRCDFSVVMRGNRYVSGDGSAAFSVDTTSGNLSMKTE